MLDDTPSELRDLVEHRTVTLDGLEFHLVEAGPQDGRPLLLLHGFPEYWYGWHRQIPQLAAAGFRVTVPDQRGYNLSAKPRGVAAYGMDRLSQDVVDLIDVLGHERVDLAGHDWGAAVAWWVAVRFPERLRRVAVLNVPHPSVMRRHLRTSLRQLRRSWYMFLFQLPWLPEALLRRNDFAFPAKGLVAIARCGTFSDEDLARYRRAWSRPGALTAMLNWYRAALRVPPKRVPGGLRVRVPMRILWGMQDPALGSEMVEPSLAYCDHGEAVRLAELTHWLQHEDPRRIGDLLTEFFASP